MFRNTQTQKQSNRRSKFIELSYDKFVNNKVIEAINGKDNNNCTVYVRIKAIV